MSYAHVSRIAKERINLSEFDIGAFRRRRAVTRGLIFEVPGENVISLVADEFRRVLADEGVRIGRPARRAKLRVRGFDESVVLEEVLLEVSRADEYDFRDIRLGEIRRVPGELYSVWVQCPTQAARKIAREERLRMGWVYAPVELLPIRSMQCHRCSEVGHVQAKCPGPDRSGRCYRCGSTARLRVRSGLPVVRSARIRGETGHRLGSKSCSQRTIREKGSERGDRVGDPPPYHGATRARQTSSPPVSHQEHGSPAGETQKSPPLKKSGPREVGRPSLRGNVSVSSVTLTQSRLQDPAVGPNVVAVPSGASSVASTGVAVGRATTCKIPASSSGLLGSLVRRSLSADGRVGPD